MHFSSAACLALAEAERERKKKKWVFQIKTKNVCLSFFAQARGTAAPNGVATYG